MRRIIERKIRYDSTLAEYTCEVVKLTKKYAVLTYEMAETVMVGTTEADMKIPAGSRTYAYYWTDRPYNIYIWRARSGEFLGAYFNIVKNTRITDQVVSFEDLIVDLLVRPDGCSFILDKEELPEPLGNFENGCVHRTLDHLAESCDRLLPPILAETRIMGSEESSNKKLPFTRYRAEKSSGDLTIVMYHGWGSSADVFEEKAGILSSLGYQVILPELIYHDRRANIGDHFNPQSAQRYFWKTIFRSIDEAPDLLRLLKCRPNRVVLMGSSMGGFIASGIFSSMKGLAGLIVVNGSGSFSLSESIFREKDGRKELTEGERVEFSRYNPVERPILNDAPQLLMHGDSDSIVSIKGEEDYVKITREKADNASLTFKTFPGIDHQFTEPMFHEMVHWLKNNVG